MRGWWIWKDSNKSIGLWGESSEMSHLTAKSVQGASLSLENVHGHHQERKITDNRLSLLPVQWKVNFEVAIVLELVVSLNVN